MNVNILIVVHQSRVVNNGGDAVRGRNVKWKDITNSKEL
jgi:hypothetical protein